MSDVRDILPPEDGWVAAIYPLPEISDADAQAAMERLIADIPTTEFHLSGTWDDVGQSEDCRG